MLLTPFYFISNRFNDVQRGCFLHVVIVISSCSLEKQDQRHLYPGYWRYLKGDLLKSQRRQSKKMITVT